MSFNLLFSNKPDFPLKYGINNSVNAGFLSNGKYIKEDLDIPLLYEDSENSDIDFSRLLEYDVLRSVGAGILVSLRFQEIIKTHFRDEIQLLSSIFNYKGKTCSDYCVANIYNKLDCYDLEKSIYKIHPVDQSYKFEKIFLKDELEEYDVNYNIIRCIHDNKIVVSEKFKNEMISNKINGLKFSK